MTYTFKLRSDVFFSNGDPFNAYVVWWSLYRNLYLNLAIDSPLYLYFNTTGVSVGDLNAFNSPTNVPSNQTLLSIMQNPHDSVTVIDPTTIEFHLSSPFVAFLQQIPAGPPWTPIDPNVVMQHGGVVASQPNSWMSFNGSSVGDGPYVVQKYLANHYTVLVKNPNYWAANLTNPNFILHPALRIEHSHKLRD